MARTRSAPVERDGMSDLVEDAERDGEHPLETPSEESQRISESDRPVIAKLARIMAELPTMEPTGRNQHFGYNYITDKQINAVVRPRMAREHLMVIPEVLEESWVETKTAKGGTSWVTKLKVRFTVIDSDSGDEVSGTGFGYGDDSGDKGANKAFTAAMKYWILKLFQMGGEDDLENDQRADERASGREAGGQAPQVRVDGAQISGVQRGGRSDRVTGTQNRQITELYKALQLTPETFAAFLQEKIGKQLEVPDGDPEPALKAFLLGQTADEAGALIQALLFEKDARESAGANQSDPEDDGIPEDDGSTPYG